MLLNSCTLVASVSNYKKQFGCNQTYREIISLVIKLKVILKFRQTLPESRADVLREEVGARIVALYFAKKKKK